MSASSSSPLAVTQPSRATLGCAIPFGLLFATVGFVAFWHVSLHPLLRAAASARWVETPCEILSGELESHSDSDGSTYRVAIRYRYEWPPADLAVEDGALIGAAPAAAHARRTHESDRYDFSGGTTNIGVKRMRDAVRAHPPGLRTVCYVDPADPDAAVLSRALPRSIWFGALTLLFPAFGALFICLAWKTSREAKAAARSPLGNSGSSPLHFSSPDYGDPVPSGETLLKPAAGRLGTFIGLTFFALFWNGLVSIFVVQAVKEFGRGFFGWFLPVFLIPFVLIGLLLLGAAFQAFSRLFAPSVELRLDPSLLRLGARVPFTWRLGGRGVRRLTIRLVAREEATYQQGTSTTTDKADCHRAIVFESTDPLGLAEGRADLVLPAEAAAPAFSAKNNKLLWELAFDGEIPWRADVDDRFLLSIRGPEHPPASAAAPEPVAHTGGGLTLWTIDRFAPGETLVFTLSRDASAPPGSLTVQLGWFTEGKSTRDTAIAWSEYLSDLAPGADRSFEVRLPETPWSFSGKLVSVAWRLEVLDAKREPLIAVPLVIGPGGQSVTLTELPKETLSRRWKGFRHSFR
ncbi:MAG: DUF3592 domain-containing protein [Burkholderiales bacterium]|nr:DUF3592 domain-containing protein [Opitutaceae bacterium]